MSTLQESWLAELETICDQLLETEILWYVSYDWNDWVELYNEGMNPEEAFNEVFGNDN